MLYPPNNRGLRRSSSWSSDLSAFLSQRLTHAFLFLVKVLTVNAFSCN